MKRIIRVSSDIVLLMLALTGSIVQAQQSKNWNILLITVDTLRWDYVGYSGKSLAVTPEIDRLAQESVIFEHAYSHNPVTLPAHANILTGRLPIAHGARDNSTFQLTADEFLISEFLKEKGYRTGAFVGAFPVTSQFGFNQGFDVFNEEIDAPTQSAILSIERPAEKVMDPALTWIGQQKGKWFAWIHLYDPHFPYTAPQPFRERHPRNPYAGEVAYVDAQLRKLFTQLRQSRQLERTLIVFTGDHGEALGEKGEATHSYFAYNCVLRVPLFIHIPGHKAVRVTENASHVDIFPTVCTLLGTPPPKGLQGESLMPLIKGEKRKESRIYFESLTPYFAFSWAPLHGYIRGHEKFIDLPIPELFQLDRDANEEMNLARNRDISSYQQGLAFIMKRNTQVKKETASFKPDEQIMQKMRSLGYLSGDSPKSTEIKTTKNKEIDLKTMLPLYQLHENGMTSYLLGRTDQAVQKYIELTRKAPYFSWVYTLIYTMLLELNRPEDGLLILQKGFEALPNDKRLQAKLGVAYAEAGNTQAAIPLLETCLRSDPQNPIILNSLGLSYERSGNITMAQTHFEKSLQFDPRSAATHNNLGNLFLNRFFKEKIEKWQQKALHHFQKAKSLSPKMANALNGLAMALFYGGRREEAIAELEAAEKLYPSHRMILYNFAIVLFENGRPKDALPRLLKFRQLYGKTLSQEQQQRLDARIAAASR